MSAVSLAVPQPYVKTRFLCESGVYQWAEQLGSELQAPPFSASPVPGLQMGTAVPSFLCGCLPSELRSHTCMLACS